MVKKIFNLFKRISAKKYIMRLILEIYCRMWFLWVGVLVLVRFYLFNKDHLVLKVREKPKIYSFKYRRVTKRKDEARG